MSLEHKVENESKGMLKKALKTTFYAGVAAGSALLSYGLVGVSGPLTGVAFAAGSKIVNAFSKNPDEKSKGLEGLLKDFSVGSLTGIVGVWGFDYAAHLFPEPGIARALFGLTAANSTFTGAYLASDYIIKNDFNPTGIAKHFKDNYWNVFKDSTLWLGLPVALTINGYGIPANIAGLDMRGYPSILLADTAYRAVAGLSQNKSAGHSMVPAHAH